MSSIIADNVLAATHKLVHQAMHGQWAEVPRTVEERRVLLDRLTASASPADQQWLGALRQAMAESDAAVAKIAAIDAPQAAQAVTGNDAPVAAPDAVATTLDLILKGR